MPITPASGNTYFEQDATIWLKNFDGFDPLIWGGRCMRVDESTVEDGNLVVKTRLDPRGGLERDPAVRLGMPGMASGTLVMKLLQSNRNKTELRNCLWVLDQRWHCQGKDRDAPAAWEYIKRTCPTRFGTRSLAGSTWEDGEAEALVSHPYQGLTEIDLYQIAAEYGVLEFFEGGGLAASINDVSTCHGAICPAYCDPQRDCVVVAVTEPDTVYSDPWLLINLNGGNLPSWTGLALSEWLLGADAIWCAGEFLVIVSEGERAILRSDDLGTTRVEIDGVTGVTDWAAHAPLQIDGFDQSDIVIVGKDGYIWQSQDGARTWVTKDRGDASGGADLTKVKIAKDNPMVRYAIGATGEVVKSENGGDNWFPLVGPSAPAPLLAILVKNQSDLILVDNAAGVHTTEDGGQTWNTQSLPDGFPDAALTHASLEMCGCDRVWMSGTDGTAHAVLENIDGGADGKWYQVAGQTIPDDPIALACCDPNRVIVVGGDGTTTEVIGLIA